MTDEAKTLSYQDHVVAPLSNARPGSSGTFDAWFSSPMTAAEIDQIMPKGWHRVDPDVATVK
jgi:hypothetical protein